MKKKCDTSHLTACLNKNVRETLVLSEVPKLFQSKNFKFKQNEL